MASEDATKRRGCECIDEKIDAGVEGHQAVGDGDPAQGPEANTVAVVVNGGAQGVQGEEFVDVEDETRCVAKEK